VLPHHCNEIVEKKYKFVDKMWILPVAILSKE